MTSKSYRKKREAENIELAFYYLSKCGFVLADAKTALRSHLRKKYNSNPSESKLNRIFQKAGADAAKQLETDTFRNLRLQLLVTAQNVLQKAQDDFKQNGDMQEMLDALKFFGELSAFINNTNTTVNINQDNSQSMEFNVDELILSLQGGMDRITPLLERVRALGSLPSGESPFYVHPTRETKDIISIPAEGDMGARGKSKR